jgi:DNA-binding LacI/PurR family transcriptional regulator
MQMIADAVGVGKVSVSRAFRGDPKCGAALRARILAKAEELGYAPDPLQRAHMTQLRAGRPTEAVGTVIGFLDMHSAGYKLETCPANGRFVRGAQARAVELGLRLEVFRPVEAGLSPERFRRVLLTRGIHGLIVGPMPAAHSRLDLDLGGIAAVAIAHSLESPVLHRVGHNHYQATWDALEFLYAQGRRRFGLAIQEDLMERVGQRWHAAYHEFCRTHAGAESLPSITLQAKTQDVQAGLQHAASVQDRVRENCLDTVLGLSPWLVTLIRSGGWSVPEDVVYFDLDTYPEKFQEATPGIDQNYEGIGATAVDELMAQWGRRDYGVPEVSKTILLDGLIVA